MIVEPRRRPLAGRMPPGRPPPPRTGLPRPRGPARQTRNHIRSPEHPRYHVTIDTINPATEELTPPPRGAP